MGQRAIDTTYLMRCIGTLERALDGLGGHDDGDVVYGLYREMCVKEFELVLEQSGKLLRKRLRPWFASNRQADRLTFKDLFRHAAKYGLLPADACERWLEYRDNRNDTAHDGGQGFAEAALKLLPGFIADAKTLAAVIDGPAMSDAPPAKGQAAGALHLPDRHRATLEALLQEHLPDAEVWAYGSRVNGRSHDGSDLDLVLRGPGLAKIDAMRYADFLEAVEESTIPFLVEAHDWASVPESFHREAEHNHFVITASSVVGGSENDSEHDWLYHPVFPKQWKRRSLFSLAQWVNGLAFRDIQFSATGMPVIKIAEIKGGISQQTKFTMQTFDDSIRVRDGDLLFSWSGQPDSSIDAFRWRGADGWLNQHVFRVTPDEGVDTTFFYYLLRYLRPHFIEIARNKQTTGLGHVTKRDLANLEAAIPPPTEQRIIAHVLGTLDDKIELNRRMNETLEAMVRVLFRSWFIDFDPVRAKQEGRDTSMPNHLADLFPNRLVESRVGEVPEGWAVVPLSELIVVNPRRSLSKGQIAPYLDMANMPTNGHSPDTVIERPFGSGTRFINGDTLVARITPCLENGKTAYVDFLDGGVTGWGSTEYIVMRPKPPIPNVFAYCLARSPRFRAFLIRNMSGTSGRQRVSTQVLSQFLLPVPSERCAVAFGEAVRPFVARARDAALESHQLAAIRDILLPALISGALRGDRREAFSEAMV